MLSTSALKRLCLAHHWLTLHEHRDRTLAEWSIGAGIGLRTLTRLIAGARVDRRSVELAFRSVGLELEPQDMLSYARPSNRTVLNLHGRDMESA